MERIRRTAGGYFTRLVVPLLARTSVTPNAISWFGVLLTLGAAALIVSGQLFVGGLAVIVAGLFDTLDGALARSIGRVTRFGAILDSTLDRFSEAVLLLSLLPVYARQQSTLGIIVVGLALIGSYLVSYIRARAEAMGIECGVGVFTRPERVAVLALGLLLSPINLAFLTGALAIIAVLGFISAGQRLYHAWRETK
ncbi:MAG: CDP-alcohol phosphatidyltransferase family protein [Chloroflexi bacterium]|nr:CDP-alcohol phosphatidyltransferase family protein [Chloroflexota bacterium]